MRISTFTAGCFSLLAIFSASGASSLNSTSAMQATGMSPTGKYVVGSRGLTNTDDCFSSAIWNVADPGAIPEFMTIYDPSDINSGGAFVCVNDLAMIGGCRMAIPSSYDESPDGHKKAYFNSAAIWRDGKVYECGFGSYTIDDFSKTGDGATIVAISDDGNTALGTITLDGLKVESGIWKYDSSKDEYAYNALPDASECPVGYDMSGDATVIVGSIDGNKAPGVSQACVWTLHGDKYVADLIESRLPVSNAMLSNNGNYAAIVSLPDTTYLLDIKTGELKENLYSEYFNIWKIGGIGNSGNFITVYTSFDGEKICADYYDNHDETIKFIDDVFKQIPDFPLTLDEIQKLEIIEMSADSNIILARGKEGSYWINIDSNSVSGIKSTETGIKPDITITGNKLTAQNAETTKILLYDINGKLLRQASGQEMSLENMMSGIYLVKLNMTGGENKTLKISIKR